MKILYYICIDHIYSSLPKIRKNEINEFQQASKPASQQYLVGPPLELLGFNVIHLKIFSSLILLLFSTTLFSSNIFSVFEDGSLTPFKVGGIELVPGKKAKSSLKIDKSNSCSLNLGSGNGFPNLSGCGLSENVSYCINLSGDFVIDINFKFSACTFVCSPGARILVLPTKRLGMYYCNLYGVNKLWRGIELGTNSGIVLDNTEIKDAEYGLRLELFNRGFIYRTKFLNCYIGILGPFAEVPNYVSFSLFADNEFRTITGTTLKQHYNSQETNNITSNGRGYAGVAIYNYSLFEIGKSSKLSTDRNHFYNLNNGIISFNSDVFVANSDFKYIFSPQSTINTGAVPKPYGVGVYSNSYSNYPSSLEVIDNNNSITFLSVQNAVDTKNTERIKVSNCKFEALEMLGGEATAPSGYTRSILAVGAEYLNSIFSNVEITNNIITNYAGGVINNFPKFPNTGETNKISNNNISWNSSFIGCANSSRAQGIFHGNSYGAGILIGFTEVNNNTIKYLTKIPSLHFRGIILPLTSKNVVNNNLIELQQSNFSPASFIGIQNWVTLAQYISNNTIKGQSTFPYQGVNRAIFERSGSVNSILCNDLYTTASGLIFQYNNVEDNIGFNTMHNHGKAFHVDQTGTITPAEGNVNKGNRWLSSNCSTCLDGVNDNNTTPLPISGITVPDVLTYKPQAADPFWVTVDNTLIPPANICPVTPPNLISFTSSSYYNDVFTSNGGSNSGISGDLFWKRWNILSADRANSTYYPSNSIISNWIASQSNSSLVKLYNIFNKRNSLGITSTLASQNVVLDSLIKKEQIQYFAIQAQMANTSDSLYAIRMLDLDSINQLLTNLRIQKRNLFETFVSQRNIEKNLLVQELNNMVCVSDREQYLKEILTVYLNTFSLGIKQLTPSEVQLVNSLSELCVLNGGPGADLARMVRYEIGGAPDFDQDPPCTTRESESVNELKVARNLFLLFPNPTEDNLVIEPSENRKYSYSITSMNGALIMTGQGAGRSSINVSELFSGMYLVNIIDEKGHTESLKFLKL